jgi:hypothetical protein
MGSSERETLVAEVVHGSVANLDSDLKEAYCIRGDGVFSRGHGGLVNNAAAYDYLVTNEYFREETRGDKTVIFATEKLLNELEAFLR